MRNRAKCKLCNDIIESHHQHDYVSCSCKEIAVDGGSEAFRCLAGNWSNFLRIADDGSEIEIKVQEENQDPKEDNILQQKAENEISKTDLMKHFRDHLKHIERLPAHVRESFVTNLDLESVLTLIYSIFNAK